MPEGAGPVTYACPMHPEVTSDQPGRCPKCGMKLLAVEPASQPMADHHHAATHHDHDAGMQHDMAMGEDAEVMRQGIEWEDDMVDGQSAEYDRDHALEVPRSHRWGRQHGNRLQRCDRGTSSMVELRGLTMSFIRSLPPDLRFVARGHVVVHPRIVVVCREVVVR